MTAGGERRLRLQAEEVVALAAGPAVDAAEALESLDAAAARLVAAGEVPPTLADSVLGAVVDALVVRGADWLVPTLPALDVADLYARAFADEGDGDDAVPPPGAPGPAPAPASLSPGKWWERLEPVESAGPPSAEHHRLVWVEGALALADHRDPEAERAIGALGGERCPCLEVARAWAAAHTDADVGEWFLTVAARHPAEVLTPPVEAVVELTADLRRWRAAAAELVAEVAATHDAGRLARVQRRLQPVEAAAEDRLGFLLLLHLDQSLQQRLQASVAAAMPIGPALEVATAARALPGLRALGWTGAMGDITLADGPAVIEDGAATLPRSWLSTTWLREAAMAPGKAQVADGVAQWENAGVATTPRAT